MSPTSFQFISYKFQPAKKRIVFNYRINFQSAKPLEFSETVVLPRVPNLKNLDQRLIKQLLADLHLILGISYYKLYCPRKVILPYKLSKEQAQFWTTVYRNGLGEFYYRNKLDPDKSPKFPFVKNVSTGSYKLERKNRALVGIGGGKDSIVVVELLKRGKQNFTSFILDTEKASPITAQVVKAIGAGKLEVKRYLDQKIFLPHPGAYNGHVPFSAILAFLGLLTAAFYDYNEVIVGNEYSSSFGNIRYQELEVNHQWSKSLEFETMFQQYVKNFITADIKYFSLLRPYYEIRVAKMFAKYEKYHKFFSSCNGNFKINKQRNKTPWCGQCPKCAFVFALLSAFLPRQRVIKIFGKNLYADKKLLPLYRDLLGAGDMKPFECVGTFEETRAAMFLAKKKFSRDYIIKALNKEISQGQKYPKKLLAFQDVENMPPQRRLLGLEYILLLGYGKEGRTSEKYLKKFFPWIKIGLADQTISRDYLKRQADYEFAFKTPGLSKNFVTIPYTTATNLFFSQVKNRIIGVTGSKGKSTTASLIYEIFKAGGLDVELVGNIGKPMLEKLLKPVAKDKIFVTELSSYQLDDIEYSPSIAVVTNLFPEHMNYHGGEQSYYEAKKNIIKFQHHDDYLIYSSKEARLKTWLKDVKVKSLPFVRKLPLDGKQIPLLGRHNLENIRAAITVAKLFKIPDTKIVQAIKKFKSLPHRLQMIGVYRGISFYDDAISTTPESTIAAIKALKNVGTIFLGGEDRGYNFRQLEKTVKSYKIKNVVLFPDSGRRIFRSIKGLNVLNTRKMQTAVAFAYKNTPRGKICLLSAASPSYSLWKNFEEKGNEFVKWIKFYNNVTV